MDQMQLPPTLGEDDSDAEDYSLSVNAVIRRASTRKSKKRRHSRRGSSPFLDIASGSGRRRSSVFTTSSGDTAISVEENMGSELTKQQIFENIRLHKEVLSDVKMQPWPMRKKLKLVMQAKSYVKRHEGALQERFTQTHSIKNILARWNIYLIKRWQRCRREIANLSNWLIPWERRIKAIESHFGSVVASYFIFLRWLFSVNIVISSVLVAFVSVPEIIITSTKTDTGRKHILPEDKYNATNFLTLWDFEGLFKYTPLFYGWYTNKESYNTIYRLPLAYFMTELVVYVYSFVATLRKMAKNSRMSKLSEKGDECVFSWKLFTGWDYMMGNPETAQNRVMSVVLSFKEALLEEAEKKRKERDWKVIAIRVCVNFTVLVLFALSAAAVFFTVKRSTEEDATKDVWRRNETTVVMTLISFIYPMILECLGFMERYHPRKQLRNQLARIMLLNLLNLYSLIFAQFDKIDDMTTELLNYKPNITPIPVDPVESTMYITTPIIELDVETITTCYRVCYNNTMDELNVRQAISSIVATVATTALPKLVSLLKYQSVNSTSIDYDSLHINDTTPYYNETIMGPFIETSAYCCDNETSFNFTDDGGIFNSSSGLNEEVLLLESFQNSFENFLEALSMVNSSNATFLGENSTNATTIWENPSTYEYFKATMAPIFNITDTSDERFDGNFTDLYDNITNTISSTEAIYAIIEVWNECRDQCDVHYVTFPIEETNITEPTPTTDLLDNNKVSYATRTRIRSLCWETMFGQELVKLTVMDFVFTVVGTFSIDFIRGVFVRFMNRCWCWDLEKKFPEYGEFKVAENILHLVNNQGMIWMGMFFSPGLVLINVIKLSLLMYLRSWAVLTCNVPHEVIFRASRSNNFYFALLLTMLFLCVLPVGYAIVWVEPSWHCGPFSNNYRIFHILTRAIKKIVPKSMHNMLNYFTSPGIVIPLLVLLVLIIYYLISLTNSLREANADLKIQLRQERTEERRKMFQIVDRRRRAGSASSDNLDNAPFGKWKNLIGATLNAKSPEENAKEPSPLSNNVEANKTRDIMAKFIKRALRKPSTPSEGESVINQDTDTDQPESLPEDIATSREVKALPFNGTGARRKESRASVDEGKHVQIVETAEASRPPKDDRRKEEWRRSRNSSSPTRSSSSKDTRHDSIASNWSDNIPVITISKTESTQCIPDQYRGEQKQKEGISSSSDTLMADDHVLKPQKLDEVSEKSISGGDEEETEDDTTKTTIKSVPLEKEEKDTLSESSTEYNDTTLP